MENGCHLTELCILCPQLLVSLFVYSHLVHATVLYAKSAFRVDMDCVSWCAFISTVLWPLKRVSGQGFLRI